MSQRISQRIVAAFTFAEFVRNRLEKSGLVAFDSDICQMGRRFRDETSELEYSFAKGKLNTRKLRRRMTTSILRILG